MKILLLDLKPVFEPRTDKLEKWARPRPVIYVARCQGIPVYIGCTSRGIRRRLQEHQAKPSLFGYSFSTYPDYDWTLELHFPTDLWTANGLLRLERRLIRRYMPQCNTKLNFRGRTTTPPLFNLRIWERAEHFGYMHEWHAAPWNDEAAALHRYIDGKLTAQPVNLIIRATDPYKYCFPNTPAYNREATRKFVEELDARRARVTAEREALRSEQASYWQGVAVKAGETIERIRREGPTFEQLMAMPLDEFERYLGIPKVAK